MKSTIGLLIISLYLFVSCSKESKQPEETKSSVPDQTNVELAKRYQVKSGIITYDISNNMMGGKITQILYFDDYGAKEARETITEMSMMGQMIKTHKLDVAKDGYFYNLDLDKKTGKKQKAFFQKVPSMILANFHKKC